VPSRGVDGTGIGRYPSSPLARQEDHPRRMVKAKAGMRPGDHGASYHVYMHYVNIHSL
jgi:hypothetical protein